MAHVQDRSMRMRHFRPALAGPAADRRLEGRLLAASLLRSWDFGLIGASVSVGQVGGTTGAWRSDDTADIAVAIATLSGSGRNPETGRSWTGSGSADTTLDDRESNDPARGADAITLTTYLSNTITEPTKGVDGGESFLDVASGTSTSRLTYDLINLGGATTVRLAGTFELHWTPVADQDHLVLDGLSINFRAPGIEVIAQGDTLSYTVYQNGLMTNRTIDGVSMRSVDLVLSYVVTVPADNISPDTDGNPANLEIHSDVSARMTYPAYAFDFSTDTDVTAKNSLSLAYTLRVV